MTGLLLTTLLGLSPGIQLADTAAGRHVRLVDDEGAPNLEAMTREQLAVELHRLEGERPGLGGPIAALAIGVALIIPGVVVSIVGSGLLVASLATRTSMGLGVVVGALVLGVGVVMAGVGIILAIVGGITLGAKIRGRTLNGRAQDEVRRRMEALDNGIPPPLPVPSGPQANLVVPGPMQTVFTF